MKYYSKRGRVVVLQGDIEAARRCFGGTIKVYQSIPTYKQPRLVHNPVQEEQKTLLDVGSVDLYTCFTKDELRKERKYGENARPAAEREKHVQPLLPIPGAYFELIFL